MAQAVPYLLVAGAEGLRATTQATAQKRALERQSYAADLKANEDMILRLKRARSTLASQRVLAASRGQLSGSILQTHLHDLNEASRTIDRYRQIEGGDAQRQAADSVNPLFIGLVSGIAQGAGAYGGDLLSQKRTPDA